MFSRLPEDVVLNIFNKLEDDPRHWARLACSCTKFSSLIRNVCCKTKCLSALPSVVSSSSDPPPGYWASLHKLAVCCPGLLHSGVLFDNSDFGLERELGPDHQSQSSTSSSQITHQPPPPLPPDCAWSLYDDLYFDTVYDDSESSFATAATSGNETAAVSVAVGGEFPISKRLKICRSMRSHLASGAWNLSREQGNKLLHSRFRGDCLYICDWPGCVHVEEKRSYMLFRGFFKDFEGSQVWRNIKDGKRTQVDLNCAYCSCNHTWDLHSAFCLRRGFGYHDDGEPVVRAYVCQNGHVSGAWTDLRVCMGRETGWREEEVE